MSPLGTFGEIYTAIKYYRFFLLVATWCTFWGRYFLSLMILLKNTVLISEKSLKSLHEDFWSPLIFKEPKFTNNFIRILKRFLKVLRLFVPVKKRISLQYLWDILQKSPKRYFTFEDHSGSLKIFEYLLNIFNLAKMRRTCWNILRSHCIACSICIFSFWKKCMIIQVQ